MARRDLGNPLKKERCHIQSRWRRDKKKRFSFFVFGFPFLNEYKPMKRIVLFLLLLNLGYGFAQEELPDITEFEEVILVGSRNKARTEVNTPVPVDVISVESLQTSFPQTTAQDILHYLVPSFNAVRQSQSDGTEFIDPVTLRGMGPDQVLVLINGKRLHSSSLVNYQNTVGNGSVGTDLSQIPVSAINRIEVLRDGAAAQYGSDAIAGVINIILKSNDDGGTASIAFGQTGRNDGENLAADVNYGFSLGKENSYLNLTAQFSHRGKTNRTQETDLDIYGANFAYAFADDPVAARAADDRILAERGLARSDFNFEVGDASIKQSALFLNGAYALSDKWKLYSFGGFSYKDGQGYAFRRLPSESENVVHSIYPDGFQPEILTKGYDFTYTVGAEYDYEDWFLDVSNTYGSNVFKYHLKNTNNASMGDRSPTRFYAGSHAFFQNTFNVDVSKTIDRLNVAFGAEWRYERYRISAGDPDSYLQYDQNGQVVAPDTPEDQVLGVGGAQGFMGFSPDNALAKGRNSEALYVDLAYDGQNFNLDAAARFEHYSDFGSALTGKLAARYEVLPSFALRGAVGTGFRAPSLHQQYFNNSFVDISTTGQGMVNKGIFNSEMPVTAALGIGDLKREKSVDFSAGFTYKPTRQFSLTADTYYIKVKDRIVLTSQFTDPIFDTYNVESGRFFTNAIDTRTQGIDLVASYDFYVGEGNLGVSLAGNYTKTKITDFHFPDGLKGNRDEFFGPDQVNIIESLSPKAKATLGLDYQIHKLGITVRNTYFGKVVRDGFPFGEVQEFSPRVVTDLSIGYDFSQQLNFTLGAHNLFDVFPELQAYDNSYYGVFKYAPVQMGFNGNYFFGRLTYKL